MYADATRVRQILLNLLSNAAKFTQKGQVALHVHDDPDVPGQVVFVISDTGIGIPEEQLATLFEPFVQGDVTTTRKYGGSGLGLAITQHYCHLMGGTISVESRVGEGSRFTVRLPRYVETPSQRLPRINFD